MPDFFEPTESLIFSEKLVNGRYPIKVPSFMDVHDWWGNWETERFRSMEELLKPGMVLYDIGAFDGWQSAILSRFVGGGQNMVLVEPVPENWANIKATWEENGISPPGVSCVNFTAHEDSLLGWAKAGVHSGWPSEPDYSKLIAVTKFKHLSENPEPPRMKLDTLVSGWLSPQAINIDVEGAELIVLESAEKTLRAISPLVWVSVHPEFMCDRYGDDPNQMHTFMESLGYSSQYLGSDHEAHWLFRKLN